MTFWPDNTSGAISLSFDDGMDSHLSIAIPHLDQKELKATFYLTFGDEHIGERPESWQERLNRWLPIAGAGHEIGNHSLTHPCSLNIKVDWGKNLQEMTLADIETDLKIAQERLEAIFPEQPHTSFAYPCYETSVGKGLSKASYVPIVAKMFTAGRGLGELRGELANDPNYCDLHCLSSWCIERKTGAFMIGLVEQAVALGRWGIFTFHGIQEGHLPIGDTDFFELIDHLARNRDRIWISPVAEVASYICARVNQD